MLIETIMIERITTSQYSKSYAFHKTDMISRPRVSVSSPSSIFLEVDERINVFSWHLQKC